MTLHSLKYGRKKSMSDRCNQWLILNYTPIVYNHVFQVVHAVQKSSDILTLYIVATNDAQRQDWVTHLRKGQ